jgi:protein ImuB
VWSSVSSSQRILSLWLERLPTDRIARQSHEASRSRIYPTSAIHSDRARVNPSSAPHSISARAGHSPEPGSSARVALATPDLIWGSGQRDHSISARAGHSPEPGSSARVVFGKRGNLDLLLAVDAAAERLGLRAGLALAQARAMHPALAAMPEDQAADARLLEAVADWCQRYTPLVAADPPDGILLDIGGCAHLFGGETKLRDDLIARVTDFGFSARAAIAATIGAAWAAARFGDTAIIAAGDERDALAPLPLAALRLPSDMVAALASEASGQRGHAISALARLGLKRIGDILDLPRAPLMARFGAGLLRQLDRALGREDEPLSPLLPVAPYVAERNFHEPIAREEDVLAIVERLAARLETALTARGDGARRLELALFRTDGVVKRIAAGTSRPVRDPQAIRALFVERLAALGDEIDPGFGFDLARLSVLVAEPCPDEQIGLGTHEDRAELDRLVDRLSARLGRRRVSRLIAHDSHIPELAAATVPAQARAVSGAEPGWKAFRRFHAEAALSARPLRLLAKPEPIDDVFALVPDGPPVRFRWRRALHEVVAVDGPERIEGAWWSEQGGPERALIEWPRWPLAPLASAARDYFRIEDKAGLRFWLFRAGLYRDMERGLSVPRWFLHGMYA